MENAFGILSSRFRVLRGPILQNYKNAVQTVKAVITLHNYILQKCPSRRSYLSQENLRREADSGELTPGFWEAEGSRRNLQKLDHLTGNRSGTSAARNQRDALAQIMMTDELAPWQFVRALRST